MTSLFVGLGTMGAPMARRYTATTDTLLYDVSPAAAALASELGATALPSLEEVPDTVDTVLLMLPSSRIVEDVLLGAGGLLGSIPSGSLVIDMGSSDPASTVAIEAAARRYGIGLVDAPVSGGRTRAEDGTLTFMVGGSPDVVPAALPHLASMGSTVLQVGGPGSGHAAKALNNMLTAANIASAAEVLSAATRYGIAPRTMIEVINSSTGRSQATEVKFTQAVLTHRWDSGFAFDLMLKDLGIARGLLTAEGLHAPVTGIVFDVATAAAEALGGRDRPVTDHTELARYYEDRNSVSFAS